MYCKMDVDDDFYQDRKDWRRMACKCRTLPGKPRVSRGCLCPKCEKQCKECIGHGYVTSPVKRVHQVLTRVRSQIRRKLRTRGHPPGYVRMKELEIRTLLNKREREDQDHWIREYVDPGPPIRVLGVIVVLDRRRK